MLLQIIVALFVSVVIYKFFELVFNHRRYSHIPGPKRDSFLYGNVKSFQKSLKENGRLAEFWLDNFKEFGHIYHYFIMGKPIVFIADPLVIKDMVTDFKLFHQAEDAFIFSSKIYSFGITKVGFTSFCGSNSLLTSHIGGPVWAKKRKIMDPTFSLQAMTKHLSRFYSIGVRVADCLEAVQQECPGKPFEITRCIAPFTIDAISYAGFGATDSQVDVLRNHAHNFAGAMATIIGKGLSPIAILMDSKARKLVGTLQNDLKVLREMGKTLILERTSNGQFGVAKDVLDTVISANMDGETGALHMEECVDEFMSMYTAGNATTKATIQWALAALTRNPRVMEKLVEEVDNVWTAANIDGNTDASEIGGVLKEMPYLDAVIKEILRYSPPVQYVYRNNAVAVTLGGYHIPPKTLLAGSQYVMHRAEEFWDKPDEFNPDRFITSSPKPYTYFPFFLGPRQCIGKNFAILEMKCILCEVLKRLTVKLDPAAPAEPKTVQAILVMPIGNFYTVTPRVG